MSNGRKKKKKSDWVRGRPQRDAGSPTRRCSGVTLTASDYLPSRSSGPPALPGSSQAKGDLSCSALCCHPLLRAVRLKLFFRLSFVVSLMKSVFSVWELGELFIRPRGERADWTHGTSFCAKSPERSTPPPTHPTPHPHLPNTPPHLPDTPPQKKCNWLFGFQLSTSTRNP